MNHKKICFSDQLIQNRKTVVNQQNKINHFKTQFVPFTKSHQKRRATAHIATDANNLPNEIWCLIFESMDEASKRKMSVTSVRFSEIFRYVQRNKKIVWHFKIHRNSEFIEYAPPWEPCFSYYFNHFDHSWKTNFKFKMPEWAFRKTGSHPSLMLEVQAHQNLLSYSKFLRLNEILEVRTDSIITLISCHDCENYMPFQQRSKFSFVDGVEFGDLIQYSERQLKLKRIVVYNSREHDAKQKLKKLKKHELSKNPKNEKSAKHVKMFQKPWR